MRRLRPLALRLVLMAIGSTFYALGVVMNIQASIGQSPWTAFNYGVSLRTPMSLGVANIVISLAMVVLSLPFGVSPGPGTLVSIVAVGWMIDAMLQFGLVPLMSGGLDGLAMLLAGVVVNALATTFMVKANFGTGPRDSFMLAMASLTQRRVGLVKGTLEVTVLTLGWLMGAPVGIGTVVYAFSVGPCVELCFRAFGLKTIRERRVPVPKRGASP